MTQFGLFENEVGSGVLHSSTNMPAERILKAQSAEKWLNFSAVLVVSNSYRVISVGSWARALCVQPLFKIRNNFIFEMLY